MYRCYSFVLPRKTVLSSAIQQVTVINSIRAAGHRVTCSAELMLLCENASVRSLPSTPICACTDGTRL